MGREFPEAAGFAQQNETQAVAYVPQWRFMPCFRSSSVRLFRDHLGWRRCLRRCALGSTIIRRGWCGLRRQSLHYLQLPIDNKLQIAHGL